MRIVIIEDEKMVADDLEANLRSMMEEQPDIVMLGSVKEAVDYLQDAPAIDIIFSDIQLGDGLSFEIFTKVETAVPVIFCTAYDEYALDAFNANGIDYILKPFTRKILERSLQRFYNLKKVLSRNEVPPYQSLLKLMQERDTQKVSSVLVYSQDKIIPIKLERIALIYLANDVIHLLTFDGKTFFPNKSLDELEKLCGQNFFRVNRQYLVCRSAVTDVSSFFSRSLSVNLAITYKERVTVSKGRVPQFLEWLTQA